MALPEGTILEERYYIGGRIAEGGMGGIYQGYDTKLDIQVALKENYFQTPEGIQQFEQEAHILARLHHPNLPRVIDHFSFDGKQYLVMDYIEGLDLWELFTANKEPLEEKEALDYIIQICDAISYLHRQNPPIIHRDIKPQNIKVTPDGRAVLVDFGIAKMVDSSERTRTGAMAITPGFSPPEQYGGMGTNPASDVYALGATLYAILTGEYPPDSISLMAGGVKFQPPDTLNTKLSREVSYAVEYAMQVNRENRPQSATIWQQELKAIREGLEISADDGGTVPVPPLKQTQQLPDPVTRLVIPVETRPPASNPPWLWIGLTLLALALAIGSSAYVLTQANRVDPTVDTQAILLALVATATAQAKAGTTQPETDLQATLVALAATATAQLLAQVENEPSPLPPTETPTPAPSATPLPPALSPTPEPTATLTPTTGPAAVAPVLSPTPTPAEARIAFVSNRSGNADIYLMAPDGSQQTNLTNKPTTQDEFPAWLPDRQGLAFGSSNAAERRSPTITDIQIINLQSQEIVTLFTQADQPAWAPAGESLAITGVNNQLFRVEVESQESTRLTQGEGFRPSWSPDGDQIVFDDGGDLYIINRDGSGLSRLTGSTAVEIQPAWAPDGQQIAFVSDGEGNNEIYIINADGTGGTRLTHHPGNDQDPSWSPDGTQIVFTSNREGNWEIYVMQADGSNPTNLTQNPGDDIQPVWSP
jgi:eukaryotic-like serine/threonine-protein kinase